jgi:cobalt-zinc-cadmium efflux system outer membrane protein
LKHLTGQIRSARAAVAALALAVFAGAAAAQELHQHVPLTIDPTLDWNVLIETTLAAHPRSGELTARGEEAAAWAARGRQWLAAAPSLYFTYLSDGWIDDRDQREYDGGVELPLWRAGERTAVRALANSAAAESDAARAALRLEVAGLLRGALWDIAMATNANAAAKDAIETATEVLRGVERRNARGELPLADVLLAQSALLERQQAAIATAAQQVDAERAYQSLTGLQRRPAMFEEQKSGREDFDETHPLLSLATAEIERARATREFTDRAARGSPVVTLGPRRQRDALTTIFNSSFSIGVKMPVGGKAHAGTQVAQQSRALAEAEAARGTLLRRLDLDLHEAEHALLVLDGSIALAAQRRELADRQWRMAQLAFEQGEIELRELLRIEDSDRNANREAERLAIERQRTIAAFNQALGETP